MKRLQLLLPLIHIAPPRTHCLWSIHGLGQGYSILSQLHCHSWLPRAILSISCFQHKHSRPTAYWENHSLQLNHHGLALWQNPSPLPQDAPLLYGRNLGSRIPVRMALHIPCIRSQNSPGADPAGEFRHMHGSEPPQVCRSVGSV